MIPALTAANLLAWSIQVAVIVLVAGAAIHAARLQSPRVRLFCFRAVLLACLVLPFVQPTIVSAPPGSGLKPEAYGAPGSRPGAELRAWAVRVDVTPDNASPERAAARWNASGPWLPGWAVSAAIVLLGFGAAARLTWLSVGLLALRRLRHASAGPRSCGTDVERGPRGATVGPVFRPDVGRLFTPGVEQDFSPAITRAIDLTGARAEILTSPAVKHPVTFGFFRPVVLLPESYASLAETEQVAVVCHELLHVRRRDWLQIVAEEVVRTVLWFHPAVWWLLAQTDLGREQLIDQEVVALTERRQSYLNALVALALMPAGPILRPASLFLGRAHLLQRIALLSREVRMSRPRLVISIALIATALVFGGQFVVHAFPLAAAAAPATLTLPTVSAPAQMPIPPPPPPKGHLTTQSSVDVRPEAEPRLPPAAQETTQVRPTYAKVLQRMEPIVPARTGQLGADTIVTMQVTIQPSGELVSSGPVELLTLAGRERSYRAEAVNIDSFQRILDGAAREMRDTARPLDQAQYAADGARAIFDAVRMWRFEPAAQPFTTVVGFNLARSEQSGFETEPVRIGGNVPAPRKVKDVRPAYPADAQANGMQGVVILELVIDGAGIPVSAYAVRPVEALTMAAVQAALQWRFEADATYTRRLMTVTVNFTLGGGVAGGIQGGVSGGVAGGVTGGITGGIVSGRPNMPPPPPAAGAPIRVGGDIGPPRKIKDVAPVLPDIARAARVQGVVIVEIVIGPDGKVQDAKILRSIPLLDQAALDAVRQWEYTPTLLNGTPVSVIATVTVPFTSGVSGGLQGGVAGGVTGGIVSGAPGVPPPPPPPPTGLGRGLSFGPPPSEWPTYIRVGGEIKQPTRLVDVRPVYPKEAQDARVQGVVIVEALIGGDGKVQAGRILRSIPILDQAALDAVQQWQFTPTLLNGVPIPVVMTVTVNFTLM
jgi:TonB family protein